VNAAVTDQTAAAGGRTDRDQRQSAKRTRRLEMATWVPKQSTPYRLEKLVLKSSAAQYVYHLGLVMAQKSLYFFYFTLPDNNEAVKAADAIVTKKVDAVFTAIDDEVKRLTAVIDSQLPDRHTGYSDTLTFEVAMYCPEAAKIGDIVRKYDTLVDLLDTLWFAGFVKREERGALIQKYRAMIIGLARQLYLLSRQARSSVTRQRAQRDKERQEVADRRAAAAESRSADAAEAPPPAAPAAVAATATDASVEEAPAKAATPRAKRVAASA